MIRFLGTAKRFPGQPLPAVYPTDLEVAGGTILGLVGRNGAGKSTLLRLGTGLLRPTEGRVEIDGHDVAEDPEAARAGLGWVGDPPAFDRGEPPGRLLRHLARLGGASTPEAARRADAALSRAGLADRAGVPPGRLSQGQLRRLALAAAWLDGPSTLLYDEPTNGLDAEGRGILAASLDELRRAGGCAILATHRLEEVENWCDRVAVLSAGRIVTVVPGGRGSAPAARRLRIVLESPPEARIAELERLGRVVRGPATLTLEASVGPDADLVSDLATRGYRIRSVASVREDLAQYVDAGGP